MAWLTQSRPVIAYDNLVRPDLVTAVTASFTPDTGFGLDNLKYQDPSMVCKVSTTSAGDRTINIQLSSAQIINCAGVLNHNLCTQGYGYVNIGHGTGGSYTGVGSGSVTMTSNGNPNFLVRFTQQTTKTHWQFTFGQSAGDRQAFFVGMLFLGRFYEFTQNAFAEGGYRIIKDSMLSFVDSASGQAWVAQGHRKFNEDAEIEILRCSSADSIVVEDSVFANNAGRIICLLPPDNVGAQFPVGGQHTFGYITQLAKAVRCGYGMGDKYDLTLSVTGAM